MGQQLVSFSKFKKFRRIEKFKIKGSRPEAKRSNLDQAEVLVNWGPNSCMLQNTEMSWG